VHRGLSDGEKDPEGDFLHQILMRDFPFIMLVHRGPSDGEKDPAGDFLHKLS
jgi:hypothetical protein